MLGQNIHIGTQAELADFGWAGPPLSTKEGISEVDSARLKDAGRRADSLWTALQFLGVGEPCDIQTVARVIHQLVMPQSNL